MSLRYLVLLQLIRFDHLDDAELSVREFSRRSLFKLVSLKYLPWCRQLDTPCDIADGLFSLLSIDHGVLHFFLLASALDHLDSALLELYLPLFVVSGLPLLFLLPAD